MDDFKNNSPFSKWDFGGGELIKTSRMIARVHRLIQTLLL